MKKTIIALLTLAGIAAGETVTLSPLSETSGWTDVTFRENRGAWVHTEGGTLTLDDSNWGQAVSTYDLSTNLGGPLTFQFDVSRGSVSAGISITFIGTEKTLTIGTKSYGDGTVFYGVSDNVAADSYYLGDKWDQGISVSATTLLSAAFNYNAKASFQGSTSVNEGGDTILTLNVSSTTAQAPATATINLGKDFVLDKIMFCGDGDNNAKGIWTVSNMSVTGNIPEPTTATLSLLALAGLAARRRRK